MKDDLVDKIFDCRAEHEEFRRHNFSAMVRELVEIGLKTLAKESSK